MISTAPTMMVAPIPIDFGGGGVASVHDVLVAMSRLAQGDVATSIGVNMHFSVLLNIVRNWHIAVARDDADRAATLGSTLELITTAGVALSTAVSEPAPQDLTRPNTIAVRTLDGWCINGRKVFATTECATRSRRGSTR